jgi:formylglycine-generating enzyme
MGKRYFTICALVTLSAFVLPVSADVFNMGPGLTSLETVHVGNPGNIPDTEVMNDGTTGYGAVDYEYSIGKYEVTAGQYTEFLNAVAQIDTYNLYDPTMTYTWNGYGCGIQRSGSSGNYSYSVPQDWANRPVNHVSWGDAVRFVNGLHNGQPSGDQDLSTTEDGSYFLAGATNDAELLAITRKSDATWVIPSEDEWYKAAYHKNDRVTGNYFDYPTGNNSYPSNVLSNPDPGNNATFCDSGYTIGSPFYSTEVGAHENSDSPYGTFDQGGNVWEWNEALVYGSSRGMRGGSASNACNLHASDRDYFSPMDYTSDVGFRVAEVPEPCSILMLGLGSVGVLRRRRA